MQQKLDLGGSAGWRLRSTTWRGSQSCLPDRNPIKVPGCPVSGERPWLTVSCVCCHALLLGEISALCTTSLERTSECLCLVSPGLCPVQRSPFLTLICVCSLQYIVTMSTTALRGSVSPSSASLSPRRVLGTSGHTSLWVC